MQKPELGLAPEFDDTDCLRTEYKRAVVEGTTIVPCALLTWCKPMLVLGNSYSALVL